MAEYHFPLSGPEAVNGDALTDELAAAGITANVYVAGDLVVVADADEAAVRAVVDAHTPPPPPPEVTNRQILEERAANALQANATFLALAAPTQAQTLAQVKTVTKECSALIRLALGLLDSTEGT